MLKKRFQSRAKNRSKIGENFCEAKFYHFFIIGRILRKIYIENLSNKILFRFGNLCVIIFQCYRASDLILSKNLSAFFSKSKIMR